MNATPAQRAKYVAYAEARASRTASPQGPARLMSEKDLVGTGAEIAEQLYAHPRFQQVREVVFALPFNFAADDYEQILADIAGALGPAWVGGRAPS